MLYSHLAWHNEGTVFSFKIINETQREEGGGEKAPFLGNTLFYHFFDFMKGDFSVPAEWGAATNIACTVVRCCRVPFKPPAVAGNIPMGTLPAVQQLFGEGGVPLPSSPPGAEQD